MSQHAPPHGALRRAWAAWQRFGRAVGQFQARLLLSFFYFVILAPFAVALRLFADPLAIKPGAPRGWRDRAASPVDARAAASRQF
jgi:hypothetical protein